MVHPADGQAEAAGRPQAGCWWWRGNLCLKFTVLCSATKSKKPNFDIQVKPSRNPRLPRSFQHSFHFHDTISRTVFLTSTHGHLLSFTAHSSCLVHILVVGQTAGWRSREIIFPYPGRWCKVKRVARTSTPRGRCLCTDTGAGGPGRLSLSKYPQCGRTSRYPGHCSDLIEMWIR